MGILDAPGVTRASAARKALVANPSGWTWSSHPLAGNLYVDQYGQFSTTFDPTTRKATGTTTYYVDVVSGSDANNGLSAGAALSSIATACAKSGDLTVMVKGYGYSSPYFRGKAFNNATQGKNINIIGYDTGSGLPYLTTHDVLTFTLTTSQTFTYETTRSNVTECMDMVASGTPQGTRLTKMTSIATVEATVGSWWQNGSTLYVHPIDNRNLATTSASRIWALLNVVNFRNNGDFTTYLENMVVYGGIDCVRADCASSTGAVATLVNVETGMSQNGGGNNVSLNGVDSMLVDCECTRSGNDGLNYHALNSKIPRAIEINCRSTDNGHTTSDQCSTIHDAGSIIRVQGTYLRATASTIADVNGTGNGTQSWNLGCLAKGAAAGFSNWQAGLSGDTNTPGLKMWLHNCGCGDATYSAGQYGTATIYSRGSRLERNLAPVTAY